MHHTGIEKRVLKALEAFYKSDLEDALYQVAAAIDATAKKRYSSLKPTIRVKKFLADEQDLIYEFSTQHRLRAEQGARLVTVHGKLHEELHDVLYKYVRCAQSHEAEYDSSRVVLGGEFGIGQIYIEGGSLTQDQARGRFIVSKATVMALILATVCATENIKLGLQKVTIPFVNGTQLTLSNFVGNKAAFLAHSRGLFS